jgi:large subunit ribosomal protein L25
MSETANLVAESRTTVGSRASAKLRKHGRLPGVVYGHKEDVVHIHIDKLEFDRAIRKLHARTFNLTLNGKSETVLVKELQWDHLGQEMLHVDFERHDLAERVKVIIPVELRNTPKATGGGRLDQPLHQLHVECPFGSIPEAVRLDITNLTLGQPIHVRDLTLPEGVSALDAPELVVVQLKLPGAQDLADAAAATATEPEVLTAKKPKDDGDAPAKK